MNTTDFIKKLNDWDDDTLSIDDLISELEQLKEIGATHIDFSSRYEYGETYYDVKAVCIRPETDAEYEKRTADQRAREEADKQYELEQLAKLKAKYEQG